MCGHGVNFLMQLKKAWVRGAGGTCTLLRWCSARAVGGHFWSISPTRTHVQPVDAWCKCNLFQHGDSSFCVGSTGIVAPPPKTLFYLEHKVCDFTPIHIILAWPWLLAALGPWKHGCAFCNVAPAALCFLPFAMWGLSSASPPIGLLPRCFVLQRAPFVRLHF